jgi:hypothetical protein
MRFTQIANSGAASTKSAVSTSAVSQAAGFR